MQITINDTLVEIPDGETILEAARRAGYSIPSLCYAKGARHKSSCMVCAVKNRVNGQIIPACTTSPTDGMQIDTESEEVKLVRRLSLELLLSDHRADCEAPCSVVCPKGLDVERMLGYYDAGNHENAYKHIASAFDLPEIGCDTCKAPCERACRRGTIDKAVSIREIIREVIGYCEELHEAILSDVTGMSDCSGEAPPRNAGFNSRLGRFTPREKERLKQTVTTPSRCLHCACVGRTGCKLRLCAAAEGIKRSRYEACSGLPAMSKQHISGNLWFEQAKCIRCGLCVYNSTNGFTFKDRGFGMQIVLPEENRANVGEELATLCPTGAIYISSKV